VVFRVNEWRRKRTLDFSEEARTMSASSCEKTGWNGAGWSKVTLMGTRAAEEVGEEEEEDDGKLCCDGDMVGDFKSENLETIRSGLEHEVS
jgi:hypothetical protein